MGKLHEERFTWPEFIDRVISGTDTLAPEPPASQDKKKTYWDLGVGYEGAIDLALQGWNQGLEEIESLIGNMIPSIGSRIERIGWKQDVEPGQLDVAAYLEGQPECWLTPEIEIIAGQGRLFRIGVNACVSAGVSSRTIQEQGSACAALVQLLEMAGHSTEVTWAIVSNLNYLQTDNEDGYTQTEVRVKDFGESLNMARISFALTHPAMFRRLGFRILETYPAKIRRQFGITKNGGYGKVGQFRDDAGFDIQLNAQTWQGGSPEVTKAWIIQQLEQHGVHIRNEEA